jgi:hypothetical protein
VRHDSLDYRMPMRQRLVLQIFPVRTRVMLLPVRA